MAGTTPNFIIPDESRIPEGNLKAFSSILLALLTVVSFFGNIFLFTTVASSATLRTTVFNIFLLNLALINVLDTAVNMFISLLYVAHGSWSMSHEVCMLNAAMIQLLGLESVTGIALLAIDRALALLDLRRYGNRMTPSRVLTALAGVWAVGLCISAPILVKSVQVKTFPARMFCAVAAESPLGYGIALLFLYILVFLTILLAFSLILFRSHQERIGRRNNLPERPDDYTDFIVDNRQFYDHLELGKFVVVLFVVYFCLHGPYLVLNFIVQMRNSAEVIEQYNGESMLVPQDAETAITWIKFVYPVVFTFLVFGFCRDIWAKFSALICCRRANVVSMSRQNLVPELRSDNRTLEDSKVLTLVATTGGLHLRTNGVDEDGKQKEEYAFADVPEGRPLGQIRREVDAFTSDYDSEDSNNWAPEQVPKADTIEQDNLQPRQASAETEASQSHVQLEPGMEPRLPSRQNHHRSQSDSVAPLEPENLSSNRPRSATAAATAKPRASVGSLFDEWPKKPVREKTDERTIFKPKKSKTTVKPEVGKQGKKTSPGGIKRSRSGPAKAKNGVNSNGVKKPGKGRRISAD